MLSGSHMFQSTPVIANGRIGDYRVLIKCFEDVSIHARYC